MDDIIEIEPWLYKKQPIEHIPDGYIGFVYLITRIKEDENDNSPYKYIGKKIFYTKKKRKAKTKNKIEYIESDWRGYFGSSEGMKKDIKKYGKSSFIREILYLCKTKEEMTYLEVFEQFDRDVLHKKKYYNLNILGKFYKSFTKKIIGTSWKGFIEDIESPRPGMFKGKKCLNNGKVNRYVSKTEAKKIVEDTAWEYGKIIKKHCFTDGKVNIYKKDKVFIQDGFKLGCTKRRITNGKNNKLLPIEEAEEFLLNNKEWFWGFSGNENMIWIHNEEEELKIKREDYHLYPNYELGRDKVIFPKGYKFVIKDGITKKIHPELIDKFIKNGWELGNSLKKRKTLSKGDVTVKVDESEVNQYIKNGWKHGVTIKTKEKMKESNNGSTLNKIAINNGVVNKFIEKNELNKYIKNGWTKGWTDEALDNRTKDKFCSDETRQKMRENSIGKTNPNAKLIEIYNKDNKLMYSCIGNFKETCINNNLPFFTFRNSLQRNIPISGESKYKKFRGWKVVHKNDKDKK